MTLLLLVLTVFVTLTDSRADEIVFQAKGIYYTDSQGSDPGPVEMGSGNGAAVDLSPDGGFLLYVRYTSKSEGKWYDVFVRSRWGETIAKFPNEGFPTYRRVFGGRNNGPRLYSPRWSLDGSQILFARNHELITVTFREENLRKIIPVIATSIRIEFCDWAPNNRFVVSTLQHEIWIADEGSEQLLGEGFGVDVSPDESKIAFLKAPGFGGSESNRRSDKEIWIMDLDGSNERILHQYEGSVFINGFHIAWAPDSSEIAFFDRKGIKAVSLDGNVRTILGIEEARITSISWIGSFPVETAISPTSWGSLKRERVAE